MPDRSAPPARLIAALLAAAASPAVAPAALAAQQPADTAGRDRARRLDSVVVTAPPAPRAPRPSAVTADPRGLPAPVTVIGHAELDRTNLTRDVGALFRRVPGIMAHNLGQGGTGTSLKIRGFLSSTHGADVAVYVDGMPQNVPSSAIAHGMNDMSWLTPDMVERVEVIRGPFSALYGDQNRSGAVNIVTRTAAPSSVAAQGGSYGFGRGTGVLSGARGRFASLLVADAFTVDGYRANSDQRQGTVFLKQSAALGASQLALRGVYHRARWDAPGYLNLNALDDGRVPATARDTTTPPLWGDAERSSLVLTRTPARGEGGWHATAYAEGYKRTRVTGANRTDLNVQHDRRRIVGARAFESLTLRDLAALTVGAELRGDRGDATNRRWPGGRPSTTYTINQDLDLLTYGAFAQGQLRPLPRVKLVGGLRADAFAYDVGNRKLPAASVRYRKSVVTPRAGVVLTPLARLGLFANVGQGFRSVNQNEISPSGAAGPLGASGGRGDPGLAAPKVKAFDYGANALVAGRVRVAGAVYHTAVANEIVQVTPGVFASVGTSTRNGWELEASAPATAAVDVYASWGQIRRASLDDPVSAATNVLAVPRNTVKGGAAYTARVGADRLLVNADAAALSGLPYLAGTPFTRRRTRPYARYDLRATLQRGRVDYTAYGTAQPRAFSSEVALSGAAGALVEPRPTAELGVTLRYRFAGREATR